MFRRLIVCILFGVLVYLPSETYAASSSSPVEFEIVGFFGLTISPPATIDEKPSSAIHSLPITFSLASPIPEDITFSLTPNSQCTLSSSVVTLVGGSLSTSTTVTAVLDSIQEISQTCTISVTITSTNSLYNGIQTINIAVIDWYPQVIVENNKDVDENPASFAHSNTMIVKLTDNPGTPVTLLLTYDTSQGTLSPTTFTFDSTNWNTGLPLVLTAKVDNVKEDPRHPIAFRFESVPGSSAPWELRTWDFLGFVLDFNITLTELPRTGARDILPVLAFISVVLLILDLFFRSQKQPF